MYICESKIMRNVSPSFGGERNIENGILVLLIADIVKVEIELLLVFNLEVLVQLVQIVEKVGHFEHLKELRETGTYV